MIHLRKGIATVGFYNTVRTDGPSKEMLSYSETFTQKHNAIKNIVAQAKVFNSKKKIVYVEFWDDSLTKPVLKYAFNERRKNKSGIWKDKIVVRVKGK